MVVLDVSMIPDGIRLWSSLIGPRLQPSINTRIGAVVLVAKVIQMTDLPRYHVDVAVLANEHATRPVPSDFLEALRSALATPLS